MEQRRQKMTNFEYIKNMPVEEFAKQFVEVMAISNPYIANMREESIKNAIRYLESEMKQND